MVIRNYHSTKLNKKSSGGKFSEKKKDTSFEINNLEQIEIANFRQIEFSFLEETKLVKKTHGGTKSNAKTKRPFIPNGWMHISNRSEIAKLDYSLLSFKNKVKVDKIIEQTAKKFFITIGNKVIMSNHYHLMIRAKRLEDLQNFLRVINAKIARLITKAKKGNKVGKFWDGLTFSRLLTSAMEELNLKGYFQANRIQSTQGTKAREEFLKVFRQWVKEETKRVSGKSSTSAQSLEDLFAMFSTA